MISEARSQDAAMLADMSHRLMEVQGIPTPELEEIEDSFSRMLTSYYRAAILTRDGRPAGYALWRDEPGHTFLRHFFIEDWARGGGLGQQFFAALAQDWFQQDVPIYLDVMDRNGPGHAFWSKLGFTRECVGLKWIPENAFESRSHHTDGIEVIEAAPGDMPELVRLYQQLCAAHGSVYPLEEAERRLAVILKAPYRANLFREDSETVGSALWMEMGDHIFLRHFTIDEDHRRGGIGARAFRALETACFPEREIELNATDLMAGPETFWKSQGFKPVGTALRRDAKELLS
ncbi:MAG: GNAT family N-acetyltransferase [Pseudomonadota bacterium]